ncbi:MAG: DRTGG domain-containing protein [Candidatus Aminicenantaceae bacterium]
MKLKKIRDLLKAEVLCGAESLDEEITITGSSDLMSDVLAFGRPGIMLITGLVNSQSIRTADIIDAKAVVYVRGKKPDKEAIELAKSKGIPLLCTKYFMYKTCGILYSNGLSGIDNSNN